MVVIMLIAQFCQDVGGMMSISVEAAAARDSLSDDRELIHTYEVLLFSTMLHDQHFFQNFGNK